MSSAIFEDIYNIISARMSLLPMENGRFIGGAFCFLSPRLVTFGLFGLLGLPDFLIWVCLWGKLRSVFCVFFEECKCIKLF